MITRLLQGGVSATSFEKTFCILFTFKMLNLLILVLSLIYAKSLEGLVLQRQGDHDYEIAARRSESNPIMNGPDQEEPCEESNSCGNDEEGQEDEEQEDEEQEDEEPEDKRKP